MKQYVLLKFVRPVLALVIFGFSFGFMFFMLYREIPAGNKDTLNIVIGFTFGVTASVGAYYFGTSKDKSDTEQAQRFTGSIKATLTELLSKIKDNNVPMAERQDALRKLREQYPEYASVKFEDLPG